MQTNRHNRFLEAVKRRSGKDLTAQCDFVELPFNMVLFEHTATPRYVHFLTSGVASVVTTMLGGTAVEVGMLGFEGFPETSQLLGPMVGPTRCMMQVGGQGFRMDFRQFQQEFQQDRTVRELALQLVQVEAFSANQLTACNGLHDLEDRLARWLLMVQYRTGTDELPLTQEFLSDMLGSRRATVTLAAGRLQQAGLIEYRRGLIRVQQRERLEEVACECYGVLTKLLEQLYA